MSADQIEKKSWVSRRVAKAPVIETKRPKVLGCEGCTRNNVPGIKKIFSEVAGKEVMIWVQAPGVNENTKGQGLLGKPGSWWWTELARIGLKREDCDIQHTVRCFPADKNELGYWDARDPTPLEIRCCSIYNKDAIAKQKAVVWLVLGKFARESLFGKGKKPGNVFYHNGVRVFLLDHPTYFARGVSEDRLKQFREMLDLVRTTLDAPTKAGFEIYKEIRKFVKVATTPEAAVTLAKEVLAIARQEGGRVAYDEEDDTIDGTHKLLCVGACPKPGVIRVFMLHHPDNSASDADKAIVEKVVRKLIQDSHPKVLQHGNHDDDTFSKLLGVNLEGYHYDTQYASYFSEPREHSHSLTSIVARNFPRYTGYKDYVIEAVPKGLSVEDGRDVGEFHLAKVPIAKLALYNAADCHVTKLEEMRTRDRPGVPAPLVRIYTEAAYTLDKMEKFGPLLDPKFCEKLGAVYPQRQAYFKNQLRQLAAAPELNPNSHVQMKKLIYETWRLEPIETGKKPDTQKETLELLQQTYRNHKGLKALQDYREAKTERERLDAFLRSAAAHAGRVTTIWWLSGTRTGRLSSGGGSRPDKRNLGNLQNIPKGALIENALVSSAEWYDWYQMAQQRGIGPACKQYQLMDWFLAADYSQMELRVLAMVCDELEMIDLFNAGKDIHAAIGAVWSGWPEEELKEECERRTIVKTFHFGIIYGLTPKGLLQDLQAQGVKSSLAECEGHFAKYFNRFKRIKEYKEEQPKFAEAHGYVENIFGFRVPVDVRSEYKGGFWRNQAVNAPIQGAAHQVMVIALALIKRHPEKYGLIRSQMEIHDALVNVTPFARIPETLAVLKQLLEQDTVAVIKQEFGIKWPVPLKADPKIGVRFGGLVKLKDMKETVTKVMVKIGEQDKEMESLKKQFGNVLLEDSPVE